MKSAKGAFIFKDSWKEYYNLVAIMPKGISSESELFDALERRLHFPSWGRNWSALTDWLGSLWWTDKHNVIIVHNDVPALDKEDKRIYIEVLAHAVLFWRKRDEHSLTVIFPESARSEIEPILENYDPPDD